jgi:hypothetical protein
MRGHYFDEMPPASADLDAPACDDLAEFVPCLKALVVSGQIARLLIVDVETARSSAAARSATSTPSGRSSRLVTGLTRTRGHGVATKTARALADTPSPSGSSVSSLTSSPGTAHPNACSNAQPGRQGGVVVAPGRVVHRRDLVDWCRRKRHNESDSPIHEAQAVDRTGRSARTRQRSAQTRDLSPAEECG